MGALSSYGAPVSLSISDFTGLIGDPTGRSRTRPAPVGRRDRVEAQDLQGPGLQDSDPGEDGRRLERALSLRPLGAEGVVRLAARYNVAQMFERREFKQRFEAGEPDCRPPRLLYPPRSSLRFPSFSRPTSSLAAPTGCPTLNVGRDIMPGFDLDPRCVMTVPLLEGLDGVEDVEDWRLHVRYD